MANLWTPEAERLAPSGTPGTMMGVGGAKAVAHCTVGTGYDAMDRVLTDKQGEPHYLYEVTSDRLGQYFPLHVSSRSLQRGYVDVSCNKAGLVVVQIEFVAAPDGFTRYWKPGPNFRAMMRDIRDQGVPDVWIKPVARDGSLTGTSRLDWPAYLAAEGWIGHCSVPAQDHWDPGPIDTAAIFAAAPVSTFDPAIKALQAELAAAGLLTPGDIDGIDGPKTQEAKEIYMSALDDIIRKQDQARQEVVLSGGTIDRRFQRVYRALGAQGALLAALAEKVGAGDRAILDAVAEVKASLGGDDDAPVTA